MNPKLLLCLALVLSVFIQCPNPVRAEDVPKPSQALAPQQKIQELTQQRVAAQINSQRKGFGEAVVTLVEAYDFTKEVRKAYDALGDDENFLSFLEKNGIDTDKPAPRQARQLIIDYMGSSTNFRPAQVSWYALMFNFTAPWETARPLYLKVATERPNDFIPKLVTLVRKVQNNTEAEQWFVLFKESYASTSQPKERTLCLLLLPSHAAYLAGIPDSEGHLQKLSQWLAEVEKTETAERLPALKEINFIKFWVAFAQKDFVAAAEWAKDSRVRAMRPLMLILARKPAEARQSLDELKNDATLSQQERDTLASASKILDEMNAGATKRGE
jgi:hypothetical protein